MKLILVRHGETDRNKDPHRVADARLVNLNETGRRQAAAIADRLQPEHIDVIICSHLPRAQETADTIAKYHPAATRIVDELVRERDAGEFATRTVADAKEAQRQSGLGFRDWCPPGGESLRDVKKRAEQWFSDNLKQYQLETVLVVSHGFFLYSLLEVAIEDGADVERDDYAMSNCGMTMLQVHPNGRAEVIHLNEITHLKDIGAIQSRIKSDVQKNNH